jgi:hypothetical protein
MKRTPSPLALAAIACLVLGANPALAQGSRATPGGTITLDQAKAEAGAVSPGDAAGFPITLSQPGSYRLTGNLVLTDPQVDAIQITANHVTLDLNGFTIQGPVSCVGAGVNLGCTPGAASGAGVRALAVHFSGLRNGTIRGLGAGVVLGSFARVEDLVVTDTRLGAITTGPSSMVARNTVSGGLIGISATGAIRDNVVSGSRTHGIVTHGSSLAAGNTVSFTGGYGIHAPVSPVAATHNVLMLNQSGAMSGAVSLGDGFSNLCNELKC